MSRIHDALKKAAADRAAQAPAAAATTADLADSAAEIQRRIEAPERVFDADLPSARLRQIEEDPRYAGTPRLTYEELMKRCARPGWTLDARNSVFVGADSDRIGAERFRTLRSRLYQIANTQPLKKLLITSSIPAEGKTFVAANLAQSIVRQPDRRVLLIDADLRASRLHQTLGAPAGPGSERLSERRKRRVCGDPERTGRQSVLHSGRDAGFESQRIAAARADEDSAGQHGGDFRLDHHRFAAGFAGA